jgi:hypothetical protein
MTHTLTRTDNGIRRVWTFQAAGVSYYVTRKDDGRVIFDNVEHTQEEAQLFWAMLRETGAQWSASGTALSAAA